MPIQLCLTNADKETSVMRRRLFSAMGADAYEVHIQSFYSFCEGVIRDNPTLFDKTSTALISDLEKVHVYKTLIDALPKNHLLRRYRGDVYFEMYHLQNLFSSMKREGWTPEWLDNKINEYLYGLPPDKLPEESEKMEKLRAAIGEFDRSQELMQQRGRHEPEDVMNWTIRAFEENKTLLASYRQRYQYILADAPRDALQKKLVTLLMEDGGSSNPSIPGNEPPSPTTHPPNILQYNSFRDEMIGLTQHIHRLIKEEGVPPGSIAVVYKDNNYGEDLAQFLEVRKIPVYTHRTLDLFRIPLAQKIMMLLDYLAAEHDTPSGGDALLFEILHFDLFSIPPMEIAKLSVEVAEKQFSDNPGSLRRLLSERAARPPRDLFDPGLPEGMKKASRVFEKLIAEVPGVSLHTLFEDCIKETGLLDHILKSPGKEWHMQVVTALSGFIKDESRRNPDLDLEQLVLLMDMMRGGGIPIPLIQTMGDDKEAVNLLTVQDAKGLEFDHVFLAGCNASVRDKTRKPRSGYTYPDNLFGSPGQHLPDTTAPGAGSLPPLPRVGRQLYISYSGQDLSSFITDMPDGRQLPIEKVTIPGEIIAGFEFLTPAKPRIAPAEEALISRLVGKFTMNVSALNTYLKCPLEFYYKNLIRTPSAKNEAAEFGSAVHFALQRLFEKMKAHVNEQFPGKEEMLRDFDWYMHRHRGIFTKGSFARRMDYGIEVLSNYYDKYTLEWNKIVAVERNIRNVSVRGVPLKGKLDKLEFQGREVNIVDYKTGDIDRSAGRLAPPSEKDPNGGDYWRQAVFYKILVDSYEQKDWKVVSTEFDFVEPDKKKEYRKVRIAINPADITTVTQQIESTWKKIQNHDFYTGCGRPDCHWCNFVKTNDLTI